MRAFTPYASANSGKTAAMPAISRAMRSRLKTSLPRTNIRPTYAAPTMANPMRIAATVGPKMATNGART